MNDTTTCSSTLDSEIPNVEESLARHANGEAEDFKPEWKISSKAKSSGIKKNINAVTLLTVQQVVTLAVSILLVIVVLQIPTILYYINTPFLPDTYDIGIDLEDCSVQADSATQAKTDAIEFCSEVPSLLTRDQVMHYPCLTSWLASLQLIQQQPTNLTLSNDQCVLNSAIPFLCNVTQVMCGVNNTFEGDLHEQCLQVHDYNCTDNCTDYDAFLNTTLPDCACFAMEGNPSCLNALVCPEGFNVYCDGFCLPSCREFSQHSAGAITAAKAVKITFITLGLLGGIINLIMCILKRERMLQFPQIFLVYNTLISMAIMIVLVLPLIFDHSLFLCSDSNVIGSYNNPTGYCQAQGFIIHTGVLCFSGFLVFHMAHLLFALACPFRARTLMSEHSKIAHITEVIVIIILGIFPGIIVLSTSNYQIYRFPPDACYPSVELLFQTFALPVAIYSTFGLAMLFTVFTILRRTHQLNATRKSTEPMTLSRLLCAGFSSPETKSFILFWYYICAFLVVVTYLTANMQVLNSASESLDDYIDCSVTGYDPACEIYKEKLEDITRSSYYLELFAVMMACLINVTHLIYTINIDDIKSVIKRFCHDKIESA